MKGNRTTRVFILSIILALIVIGLQLSYILFLIPNPGPISGIQLFNLATQVVLYFITRYTFWYNYSMNLFEFDEEKDIVNWEIFFLIVCFEQTILLFTITKSYKIIYSILKEWIDD